MRRAQFELLKSGLATGILVVALCFQMLPIYMLLVVAAFALGVTGAGLFVFVPVLFLAMVVGACMVASKRIRLEPLRTPSRPRRQSKRPIRDVDVLIKTRTERYQDLKDILKGGWR